MTLEAAKNLGIYLISKAAQYVYGVGAPMDAVVIAGHQPEWLGDTEIKEREAAMLARGKTLPKQILTPPSSSATWPWRHRRNGGKSVATSPASKRERMKTLTTTT